MLGRLKARIAKSRRFRAKNSQSWSGCDEAGKDGKSAFQDVVLNSLQSNPGVESVEFIEGRKEGFYRGKLSNSGLTFFIYQDGAELGARHYERWDFETREDLLAELLSEARANEI